MKLIKFSAEWCGPCKAMNNVVNKVLVKFPALEFEDIDVEEEVYIPPHPPKRVKNQEGDGVRNEDFE